jgi:hypothetical protein
VAAARDAAGQRPPVPNDPSTAERPDDAAQQQARLEELRRAVAAEEAAQEAERKAFWAAAGTPDHDGAPPVGVTPEDVRAAALDRAASEGALPPTEGLEGMYQRLNDRSIPWPQLLQEMRSMGFVDR